MRQIVLAVILLLLVCRSVVAQATTYYISPTGSDSNNGLSAGAPFLMFAYALDASRASCGDTLLLMNGVYGDGTSTGKIDLSARICAIGNELTIRALNSRQARIHDNGLGQAIRLRDGTAGIIFDGITSNSTNNSSATESGAGSPFQAVIASRITVRNALMYNPNKWTNTSTLVLQESTDSLIEDTEIYDFHRHCVATGRGGIRVTVRRVYCNPRTGAIVSPLNGGNVTVVIGTGQAAFSMYPCRDCIMENVIAEGNMFLNEANATFSNNILMSGSKILGSICLDCGHGNGIYLNSRNVADLNHSPQNITVEHVAFVNHETAGDSIRVTDGVNITINRVTSIGKGTGNGLRWVDTGLGATLAQQSLTLTNTIITTRGSIGFLLSNQPGSWSGKNNTSYNNGAAYYPSLPSNWGAGSNTSDPQLGTCRVWVPNSSPSAGRGAEILYRYKNGRLTNVPLWDPTTGEFPHGALVAGVNNVAGQSLFDVHKRLNVNTNGCSFPANYGAGGTDVEAPATPANLSVF